MTDYSTMAVPDAYRCEHCGAHGVKLWRLYQTFLEHQELTCVDCTCAAEGIAEPQRDDTWPPPAIGWRVLAVPTTDGGTFWGYTSIPEDGIAWWGRLPVRAAA